MALAAVKRGEKPTHFNIKFQRFSCFTGGSIFIWLSLELKEPTSVVDWGHLNRAGGDGGLGLEPIPFKC